jgi:hypothetical protein
MSTTATANQLSFVASLIRERARTLHIDDVDAAVTALREQRITMDGASATIERLLKLPKDPPVAVAKAVDARGSLPSNRYAGRCVTCNGNVGPGEGTYRRAGGGWDTLHLPGQCPAAAAAPAAKQTFAEAVTEILGDIPDGLYAVDAVSGTNDLTFVRFATNKGILNPSKAGQRYVRQIVGGAGDLPSMTVEWVRKVAAAVEAAGFETAAIRYGQHMGRCGFCGTELTRRYSRDMGYGPNCADKHGLPFDHKAYAASQIVGKGGE